MRCILMLLYLNASFLVNIGGFITNIHPVSYEYLISISNWTLIQHEDVVLPAKEIPLWRSDGRKIVLFPKWEFLYR